MDGRAPTVVGPDKPALVVAAYPRRRSRVEGKPHRGATNYVNAALDAGARETPLCRADAARPLQRVVLVVPDAFTSGTKPPVVHRRALGRAHQERDEIVLAPSSVRTRWRSRGNTRNRLTTIDHKAKPHDLTS